MLDLVLQQLQPVVVLRWLCCGEASCAVPSSSNASLIPQRFAAAVATHKHRQQFVSRPSSVRRILPVSRQQVCVGAGITPPRSCYTAERSATRRGNVSPAITAVVCSCGGERRGRRGRPVVGKRQETGVWMAAKKADEKKEAAGGKDEQVVQLPKDSPSVLLLQEQEVPASWFQSKDDFWAGLSTNK
ncbi:uncharacterized protein V6R79_005548 [Siganus canaliculatus]